MNEVNVGEIPTVSRLDRLGVEYFQEHYNEPLIQLAHTVYIGALIKVTDHLEAGHTSVGVFGDAAAPEYTPKNYTPKNLLETILWNQPKSFEQKIDFPVKYDKMLSWRGFAQHLKDLSTIFSITPPCVVSSNFHSDGFRVGLYSQSLKRFVYIDISSKV